MITRRSLMASAAGAALAFPSRKALAQVARPTILLNGNVITLDPLKPRVSAVAIRNGLIVATGDPDDVREAVEGAEEIDLGGRTTIPGLNDSHIHVTRQGRYHALELRWDGVPTLSRALDMVREQAARTPEGQWVRVMGGWSRAQFAEGRMPTPADLTEASPETPVFVLYLYGRGFLNAAGVRKLGLTPDTETPAGTRYEFTEDGGAIVHAEPFPWLINQVVGALPSLGPDETVISTRHFYAELARFGLTSAGDMGGGGHIFPTDYAGTRALADAGEMPMRVSNYLPPYRIGEELEVFEEFVARYAVNDDLAERLREGFVVEGAGEALTVAAYDFENFLADRPDISLTPGWDRDLLAVVQLLLQARWPIRLHATYGESIALILDVFEEADRLEREAGRAGFRGIRWAFEHAETITREGIERVAALGGGISIQARMAYSGEDFVERYGEAAAADAPPVADMIAAGVPVGMGTDGTRVASYNPWPAFDWLTTGRTVGGAPLLAPRHRQSRLSTLSLYTVGSAWFTGEEARKGRIAPGQFADLAVLDRDILSVGDDDLAGTQSVLTMVGGQVTYASGPFADRASDLPPLSPSWSPPAHFGGYQR